MSLWPGDIADAAQALIALLSEKGLTVATAESCTGGLIVAALTEVPGSSRAVDRGFVTYSNQAKIDMLGVLPSTLTVHGAVSRETAVEMAEGALAQSPADLAVAVTGIAGPGGGSIDKPVGLVHLAAASGSGRRIHHELRTGDIGREAVRLETVRMALRLLTMLADQADVPA